MLDPYSTATVFVNLFSASAAGAIIGFERSYHGRPAGFRTHILVATASSLLMLLAHYQVELLKELPLDTIRIDPTRMAQGIMTGIGFLGAGVIMKAGLSVRGLTTAASIWMTASIGIMFGVGFYLPASLATVMTFMTLSIFRWIESKMPSTAFAHLSVRFPIDKCLPLDQLEALIHSQNIQTNEPSYLLTERGKHFEYRMTISCKNPDNFSKLSQALRDTQSVCEFHIVAVSEK